MNLEKKRQELEEKKFWLAMEELTFLLKENHKPLVSSIVNNGKYGRKFDKDIEIVKLSLMNLNYELQEV